MEERGQLESGAAQFGHECAFLDRFGNDTDGDCRDKDLKKESGVEDGILVSFISSLLDDQERK